MVINKGRGTTEISRRVPEVPDNTPTEIKTFLEELIRYLQSYAWEQDFGAPDSIGTSKLIDESVTEVKLEDGSVSTTKLKDDSVSLAKLSSGTADKFIGYDINGDPEEKDAPISSDENVKITASDTTSGFLNDKVSGVGLTKTIINPGADETLQLSASIQAQNVRNLILANGTETAHDIDFQRGDTNIPTVVVVRDASNNQTLLTASPSTITKQIDTTWASGSAAGGLAGALTVAANTHYYCFLLTDGTTVDFGFDTSVTAANLLADTAVTTTGLDKYVRVGSVLTDASSNILNGTWRETEGGALEFLYDTAITEITASTPPTTASTAKTVSAPASTFPYFEVSTVTNTSGRELLVHMTDKTIDVQRYVHANCNYGGGYDVDNIDYIKTDSNRQVNYALTSIGGFNGWWSWKTKGWKEVR